MLNVTVEEVHWHELGDTLRQIREQVFVQEQNVPVNEEWDGKDELATHFLAKDRRGLPVGTARLLSSGQLGRMAVLVGQRRQGVGKKLVETALASAARQRMPQVYLHAQLHAVQFYAANGFQRYGEPFLEAGIPHIAMARALVVEYEPEPVATPIVNQPRAGAIEPAENDHKGRGTERSGFARYTVSEQGLQSSESERQHFTDIASISAQMQRFVEQSARRVLIYSQELDHRLFDTQAMEAALSGLARRHQSTYIRILVHNSRRIIKEGHRIAELCQRLPSSMQLRLAHDDQYETDFTYLVADTGGVIYMPKYTEAIARSATADGPQVRKLAKHFDEQWERGHEDPNLRVLGI